MTEMHSPGGELSGAGPLDRYLGVLELIAAFPGAVTMSDVCAMLAIPKTSAHRLLGGLARAELIEGGGRHRPYTLGARLTRLLHASADGGWIATLARPILEALADERGETTYLNRLVGHTVRVACSVSPEVQWRSYVQPELEMPPHAAAAAKAILAFQSPALIGAALKSPLPALTSQTRTDKEAVLADYADVQAKGWATCVSEIDEGLGALGVPIRLDDGSVLYSLGITGPVQRIFNDEFTSRLTSLQKAASALGKTLSLGSLIAARHRA